MYESYRSFASVYDEFMDGTDYQLTADKIQDMITRYGVSKPTQKRTGVTESRDVLLAAEKNLVVDLACGTGKLTEILADRGYDVMGIDLSEEMLSMALERRDKLRHRTLYLCQDMREFELYGTAGAFISVGDSVNYLLTAEDRDDCSFIWDNWFDEETAINEYDLSLFIKESDDPEDNAFRKYQEIHRQRGYTLDEMKEFAKAAGLAWITEMDSDTMGPVREDSERILCVVQEKDKKLPHAMK